MKISIIVATISLLCSTCMPSTAWVDYENAPFQYRLQFPEKPTVETRVGL